MAEIFRVVEKNSVILDPDPHPWDNHHLVSRERDISRATNFLPSSGGNRAEQEKKKRGVKILKTGLTEKSKECKGEEQDKVRESGQCGARAAQRQHSAYAVCW